MELQGLTPVDTLYEFAGHAAGHRISEYLIWNGYLVGLLLGAGILRLYYVGSRRGSFTDLGVYPLYVLVVGLLVWPVEVAIAAPGSQTYNGTPGSSAGAGVFWYGEVGNEEGQALLGKPQAARVPRLLALTGSLVDTLQHLVVADMERTYFDAAFTWLQVAAVNDQARILDLDLRHDFGLYLSHCYWPAVAERVPGEDPGDPWKDVPFAGLPSEEGQIALYRDLPGAFQVYGRTSLYPERSTVSCLDLHGALARAIASHLDSAPFHRNALAAWESLARKEGNTALGPEAYRRFYQRRLIYNEIFVVGRSEAAVLRHALPEFDLMEGGRLSLLHTNAPDLAYLESSSPITRTWGALKNLPAVVATIVAALSEWWTQKGLGPAAYYRISSLGPWIYGMTVAFLAILFPVAALFAFWPEKWTALVNFMKVWVSVKLWPVLWSWLSAILGKRAILDPENPHGLEAALGQGGMLTSLAAMYLLAPALSYLTVSLATQAGQLGLGALAGQAHPGSLLATLGTAAAGARAGAAAAGALSHRPGGHGA